MKHLSLQQAMLGMRIVQTDKGMIIKSPAGSAEYNLKGRRIKVTGYPEYFPGQLRVKDKRTKTRGRVDISGGELTAYNEDGSVRIRVGRINQPVDAGVVHEAGTGVTVEDGKRQVEFKADRFAVIGTALSTIKNEQARIHAAEVKTRLSDDMREAVIDVIRESDVFKALLVSQDAHASALVTTQQAIEQAATDAIRNATKPGGLLYRGI
ncbi:hypothetical protein [Pseudescherichia vulneris]|uniref:hypothetical protein n=1 Tax=Pseudescherichia vulneris TaxID=566 RepID=UPI0028D6C649|nr:hypothetical protein [Pseudescherichia vulneris]